MIDCGVGGQTSNDWRGEACDKLWVVCLLNMASRLGSCSEGKARCTQQTSSWRGRLGGGVCKATRFRSGIAQPIVADVCLGDV